MLWFLAVVTGLCACWYLYTRQPPNFPPGPRYTNKSNFEQKRGENKFSFDFVRLPLPFIGDAYVLGKDVTNGFMKMSEK